MADATANTIHETRPRAGRSAHIIANGVTVYAGMLAQLESGYLNHWDEAGAFRGLVLGEGIGHGVDNSAMLGNTSATPPPEARVDESGAVLKHLTLGGTPTQAKVGDLVYCADSSVSSMTMTDTTNAPVGILTRYRSATDCDVQLFTPSEWKAGIASGTWI